MQTIRVRVTPWLEYQVRAHITQTSALVSGIIAYRDEQREATSEGRWRTQPSPSQRTESCGIFSAAQNLSFQGESWDSASFDAERLLLCTISSS